MASVGTEAGLCLDATPREARVRAEEQFGEYLRELIARAGVKFTDAARLLGVRREDLYEILDGSKHARAAWLALLPPAVELLYLEERAAHHGRELRLVEGEDSAPHTLHAVVLALGDTLRAAAEGESDGSLSPDEIARELACWEALDRVRCARAPARGRRDVA